MTDVKLARIKMQAMQIMDRAHQLRLRTEAVLTDLRMMNTKKQQRVAKKHQHHGSRIIQRVR